MSNLAMLNLLPNLWRLFAVACAVAWLGVGVTAAAPPRPFALIFAAPECEDCAAIKSWWQEHPSATAGVTLVAVNIEEPDAFTALTALEAALKVEAGDAGFPAVYVPGRLIYGADAIRPQLPALVAAARAADAEPPPVLRPVVAYLAGRTEAVVTYSFPPPAPVAATATAAPATAVTVPGVAGTVRPAAGAPAGPEHFELAYFFLPGCRKCSRQDAALRQLEKSLAGLTVTRFDITDATGRAAFERTRRVFKLPAGDAKLQVPLLVWADGWSKDKMLLPAEMRSRLRPTTEAPFWKGDLSAELAATTAGVRAEFNKFTVGVIVLAGLLDGINPCAFATVIFLVGYLLYLGRGGSTVAWLGGSFCFGVFLTYFLLGLGLSQVINWLTGHAWVKVGVYSVMGAGGLILGVLHARDAWRFRRSGCARDMEMGLSLATTRKIHGYVRQFTGTRYLVPAGLVLGFLISSLELVCTGQIYLPTLVLMNRLGTTSKTLLALLAYNLAFIWPLVLVTVLAAAGVSTQSLAGWARNHVVSSKAAMSVLFFLLGALMLAMAAGWF